MTNGELTRGLLRQAKDRLETCTTARRKKNHAYAIRSAQECVELSLKALRMAYGVDPPKWHEVSVVLRESAPKIPALESALLDELCMISRKLRDDRERSMYGDEVLKLPPDSLFSPLDAKQAAAWAKTVFVSSRRLIGRGGRS